MEEHNKAHHDHDGITENRDQRPPVYFTFLFYGLIIWGVVFSAYYLLSGWSSDAEFQEKMAAHKEQTQQTGSAAPASKQPETAAAPASEQPDGAALYAQLCAMCHGGDATGGMGPDLTTAEYSYGKTPEAVTESIAAGRDGGMPGFGNQLAQGELKALVDYLLSL